MGWNTEADGSGSDFALGVDAMPNSDVTLYAQWKSNNGGEEPGGEIGGNGGNEPDDDTSTTNTITVGNIEIPLIGGEGRSWALINLIISAVGVIAAIATLLSYLLSRNKKKHEDNRRNSRSKKGRNRLLMPRLLSAGIAGISVIVFLLTENMRLPMALVDKWTILMAVLLIGQMITIILAGRKEKEQDEED